jgi:AraC-like DNA-binding protein
MLEGFEDEWNGVESSEERTAYYARLSPGSYQFRIKACNNDNVWSDKEAVYEFRLRPHFHQTFWFYALCVCAAVLVGYGLWQMYRLKLKIRELKKYKSSSLQSVRVEEYIKKLVHMMEEKKYFTDQEMNLHKLAAILSIPPPHLSQIINVHFKQHFSDFINSYRVDEAKKKLTNPEYKHFKLTAIGHDVGFKSTSAFYTAFKKHAGTTPSDFKKNNENKEDS